MLNTKDFQKIAVIISSAPIATIGIVALCLPIVCVFSSTKFVDAAIENLILFGVISISAEFFAVWIINIVISNHKNNDTMD